MKSFLNASALAAILLASSVGLAADKPAAQPEIPQPSTAPVPAGAYVLDKLHASLLFRVSHIGFSRYTGRFTRFDAQLQFDPADPAKASVNVQIDPRSIDADGAPAGFMATLAGEQWLDAGKFPQMTYRSKSVQRVGKNGLRIDGELTLHGVTRPVVLNGTYNGGYASHPMEPRARIGFSATGTLKRSEFGLAYGIPAPGTTMGVGDDVELIIEAEFSGPPVAAGAGSGK
jgi:polyisoprenoid-binding protein YceI